MGKKSFNVGKIFFDHRIFALCASITIILIGMIGCASGYSIHNSNLGIDYSSIQDAVDDAEIGDTIVVDSGTYFEHVVVDKTLTLRGQDTGGGLPVIDLQQDYEMGIPLRLVANGITVEGFILQNGPRGASNWGGICIYSDKNIIRNCSTINFFNGIYIDTEAYGIPEDNLIMDCYVSGNYKGIWLNGKNTTLINNTITNNGIGLLLYDMKSTLQDNRIFGNGYNLDINLASDSILDLDIDTSNLVEGKPILFLKGVNDQIIDSNDNPGALYCLDCDNLTIRDVNIERNVVNIYLARTTNVVIENCILNRGGYGIWITQCSNIKILNVRSIENQFEGIKIEVTPDVLIAESTIEDLFADEGDRLVLQNNTFTENPDLENNNDETPGVSIFYCHDLVVTGNSISNNLANGVYLAYVDGIVENNHIHNNIGSGINNYCWDEDGEFGELLITNNFIENNNYGVSLAEGDENILSNNSILNNQYAGLLINTGYSNNIYNNYLNNTQNVEISASNPQITWSVSSSPGPNIVGGPSIGGNYWGAPDGTGFSDTATDANSDGFSDTPLEIYSNNVDNLPLVVSQTLNQPPLASFTYDPTSPNTTEPVIFSHTSTDSDGTITTISWDFGDGSEAEQGAQPSHRFATPGTYTVTLTVTDDDGLTDTATQNLPVTAYEEATYPLDSPGVTFAGQQIVIDTAVAGDSVVVSGTQITITYGGLVTTITTTQQVETSGGTISGEIISITVESEPLPAQFTSTGPIEAWFAADLVSLAEGATITVTLQETLDPAVLSAFELAAASEDRVVQGVAYAMVVELTNVPPASITGATIQMTASAAWVAEQGGPDAVRIVRYDAGSVTFLDTTGVDLGNGLFRFTAQSAGFSVFGLAGVEPANHAPTAADDAYVTGAGTMLSVQVTNGVLANDDDEDDDTLTAVLVNNVAQGSLILTADGSFIYTPAAGISGSDTFTYCAHDGTADSDPATVTITVQQAVNHPPEITGITVPVDPKPVNSAITASAIFTDPDTGDTLTARWVWGDGTTSSGTVGAGTVAGSHTFTTAGVYEIELTVSDGIDEVTSIATQYAVIYDPNGGFVTGGGWITSPVGAYTPDPTLTGKATLGFVSKYKKGQSMPTGETEFQFHAAGMDFHSSSYDWLVITTTKAQYKGVGTISGTGSYGFMLTAIDGDQNKVKGPDTFRIKIWDKNSHDTLVYDNQVGAGDNADPMTALGGGSIVVHNK